MSLTTIQNLFYSSVIKAAKDHGDLTEPSMEVCDLQEILKQLVTVIDDKTLTEILRDKQGAARDTLNDWMDIEEIDKQLVSAFLQADAESDLDTFTLSFDVYDASAEQEIMIISPDYDPESIIEGLEAGRLATSTWFNNNEKTYIDVVASGEHIAEVLSQELTDGSYEEFR